MNYYLSRIGIAAVALAVLVIALSPLISRGLHLNSSVLVVVFGLCVPAYVASSVVRGVHQGTRRFERYSLGTITEGITKVCCAIVLLTLVSRAPVSGMVAVLLSAVAGLVVNVLLLRHFPKPTAVVKPSQHPIRYSVSTLAVFGLLAILISIDTMTARLTLPAHEAGIYAGISLAGKIVYFATTAVNAFLFPVFSTQVDQGTGTRQWLKMAVLLVAAVSTAIVAVFAWAPYLITTILLGHQYRPVAHEIHIMGAIFSIYAMTNLLVVYLLARRQRGIVVALAIAVAVQIGGFAAFHRSVTDLMAVMAVAFSTAMLGCGFLAALALPSKAAHRDAVVTQHRKMRAQGAHSLRAPGLALSDARAGKHRASTQLHHGTFRDMRGFRHTARGRAGRHRQQGGRITERPQRIYAP